MECKYLRRYKSRLERLKKEKNLVGTCESVTIPYQGVVFKMVENTENMRLQLFFEGKPSEEIRALLKSHSFRWSGKNKCWQRYKTPRRLRGQTEDHECISRKALSFGLLCGEKKDTIVARKEVEKQIY